MGTLQEFALRVIKVQKKCGTEYKGVVTLLMCIKALTLYQLVLHNHTDFLMGAFIVHKALVNIALFQRLLNIMRNC